MSEREPKRTRDDVLNDLVDAAFLALGMANFAYLPNSIWAADPKDIMRIKFAEVLEKDDPCPIFGDRK